VQRLNTSEKSHWLESQTCPEVIIPTCRRGVGVRALQRVAAFFSLHHRVSVYRANTPESDASGSRVRLQSDLDGDLIPT
jgi:hypothetical protein